MLLNFIAFLLNPHMQPNERISTISQLSYNTPKTRVMAERGESRSEVRHALGLAVITANRLKLSYSVQVLREDEPFPLVKVEHI